MLFIWRRIENSVPGYSVILDRYYLLEGTSEDKASPKERIAYLYNILGILDSKASSLMTFDGIVLAVLAIFASRHPTLALVISLVVLGSMVLCLSVPAVMWRFLELCDPKDATTLNSEIDALCKITGIRESAYQWAWLLSLVSVLMMTGLVVYMLFESSPSP